MPRSCRVVLCALWLLSACGIPDDPYVLDAGGDGPTGNIEISCPRDVEIRILPVAAYVPVLMVDARPTSDRLRKGQPRRVALRPGVATVIVDDSEWLRLTTDLLVPKPLPSTKPFDFEPLPILKRQSGRRFEVLIVEGMTTPVQVCPSEREGGDIDVSVGALVPHDPGHDH